MTKKLFGTMPDGTAVYEYTLTSAGVTVSFITYGGRFTHYIVDGVDIMCGHETLEEYLADTSSQGAAIGRYANRIRDGLFTIDGKEHHITKNKFDRYHLHGGDIGFACRVWDVTEETDTGVLLSLLARDGEEGYPGNMTVNMRYSLIGDALVLHYEATSDADTIVNLTNHSYFNLRGCDGKDVLDHTATIYADAICDADDDLIATGKYLPVDGTAYDFRTPHTFGERIEGTRNGDGYDNHYCIQKGLPSQSIAGHSLPLIAEVHNGHLSMEVYTDRPGVQLYTACALSGKPDFRGGIARNKLSAFCLETQFHADSPNLTGEGILRAGEKFETTTVYRVTKQA